MGKLVEFGNRKSVQFPFRRRIDAWHRKTELHEPPIVGIDQQHFNFPLRNRLHHLLIRSRVYGICRAKNTIQLESIHDVIVLLVEPLIDRGHRTIDLLDGRLQSCHRNQRPEKLQKSETCNRSLLNLTVVTP